MKTILLTLALVLITNLSFSQSEIGYKYNYEIKFDVAQFIDKEPRNTVREFVDYIFETQGQKFNVQTRYSADGVLYISSDAAINECTVEGFFHAEESQMLSFEQKPQQTRRLTHNKSSVAQS